MGGRSPCADDEKSQGHRFCADPAPWKNLRAIHASVLADFAPARTLGYVLHGPAR
jgi:hypothetical protein